jgi:predicted molibdopterin-dependent oxidoreductase YjgC
MEMGALVPEYAGIRYARIEKVGLQTPVPDENHPGTPYLFAERFPRGRGKFHSLEYTPSAEMPDDDYPLILTTGRVLEHWHGGTMTNHSWIDDLYPEALAEINPVDALHLGVKNESAVRISSRRGTIVVRAKVPEKTTPGVVFVPFFYGESPANLLTNDVVDPQAKIPEYKICAIRVIPVTMAELPKPKNQQKRGRY